MTLDLDLYRREVRLSTNPLLRLSAIDISPDRPRGTIVFVHGFGGHAAQWQYQLQKLSHENRVIALDMRGHGFSDRPSSGYDMPQLLADFEKALELLEVQGEFTLVGHSFGGAVVTEYALAHPDRLDGLVLIATAGDFKLQPAFRLAFHLPNWLLRILGIFMRRWLQAPPAVLKQLHNQTLAHWVGWDKFRALRVRTLVVRGHRDQVFDRAYFEDVTRSIPSAEEADIGGSGHLVMLERRDAVNRALERFVRSEPQRLWREASFKPSTESDFADPSQEREDLLAERPWLRHYDEGVPYTTAVPEIPLHHLLRSAVRRFPRHTAIYFGGSRLSYRQLNHESNRFANALLALTAGQGCRVVLMLPNVPQMVIAFYGTLKAGDTAVLIAPTLEPSELNRQVKESLPSVLVTLDMWSGLAHQLQQNAQIPHVILTGPAEYLSLIKRILSRGKGAASEPRGALRWRQWLAGASQKSPDIEVAPGDLAVIHYTAGTAAPPRGAMLSHRNLVANAMQTRHWWPGAQEGRERFLSVVPFFHGYGMTTGMNTPIALGAAMILQPRFNAREALEAVRRYRPTMFSGTPTMYVALSNFPGVRKYGMASIKTCMSGSEPLPVEVQEAFEKLTRGRLVEGYGLTEASPVTHANPFEGGAKAGSIGIPVPSTEAAIFDLRRRKVRVKPGQIGELAVRGPQVMMGYWNNPSATREVLDEDGWLYTGDIAQQDADGYFRIVARKADMWYPRRCSKPAFPRDIEEVIYEVPQVKEVAVVGIARHPFAFVIARADRPSADSIIAYCKRRLPPELVPRFIVFTEELPRSFIGKVLRRELARRFEKHSEPGKPDTRKRTIST